MRCSACTQARMCSAWNWEVPLKNVIALAAGMADGLGYGDNTKAALITRGITEMSRLAIKMGGKGGDTERSDRNRRSDRDM